MLRSLSILAAAGVLLFAQADTGRVRTWRAANERRIVREFFDLLAIPNLASDPANLRRNAEKIAAMLRQRSVDARLIEAAGAPPAVYGEIRVPGARRTLIFYAH